MKNQPAGAPGINLVFFNALLFQLSEIIDYNFRESDIWNIYETLQKSFEALNLKHLSHSWRGGEGL